MDLKNLFTDAHTYAKTNREMYHTYQDALAAGLRQSWVKSKVSLLSDDELAALKTVIEEEQEARKPVIQEEKQEVQVEFEVKSYDSRKHGHCYVAILTADESGKLQRQFLDNLGRLYDTKRKYYDTSYSFSVPVGTVLEARLTDGSWKNDYRDWYVAEADGIREITQAEAAKLVRKGEQS